jgi:membrane-associated protein
VTLLGYLLGESIPNVDRYLLPIIGLIVVLSVAPIALEVLRGRRRARAEADRES